MIDLTTPLIALSKSFYSFHNCRASTWFQKSSKLAISVGAGSGTVSTSPTFTGAMNRRARRRLYMNSGAAKKRQPKVLPPKLLCTYAAHALTWVLRLFSDMYLGAPSMGVMRHFLKLVNRESSLEIPIFRLFVINEIFWLGWESTSAADCMV